MQIWDGIRLVPDSGAVIPSQTAASMRPRDTPQKNRINIVHKSNFVTAMQCMQQWKEFKITLMRSFLAPEIFIPDEYGTKNRR